MKAKEIVEKTLNPDAKDSQLVAWLGLLGELGEILDTYKKILFQGHPNKGIKEELADVLYYKAHLDSFKRLEFPFSEIEEDLKRKVYSVFMTLADVIDYLNYPTARKKEFLEESFKDMLGKHSTDEEELEEILWKKLSKRYPDGFTPDRSMNRED